MQPIAERRVGAAPFSVGMNIRVVFNDDDGRNGQRGAMPSVRVMPDWLVFVPESSAGQQRRLK